MSDYSVLVAALTQLQPDTDTGSGPPPSISDHEADRLAGQAAAERQATVRKGGRLLRRPFGRRPSFA